MPPRAHPPPKRTSGKLTPDTTIAELARNELLDLLSGSELVVYLRLLGLAREQNARSIQAVNAELYRDSKTAVKALGYLSGKMKLIRVKHNLRTGRTIEVLR